MRLIITRPLDDTVETISRLKVLGHEGIASPLLSIEAIPGCQIPEKAWQAILVTSANGVRALAHMQGAPKLGHVPLLAVGEASANAANETGFTQVQSASGDMSDLVALANSALSPDKGPLLYLSGTVTSGDLKGELEAAGFDVHRAMIYQATAASALPEVALAALAGGQVDGVALFSRRSGEIWVKLAKDAGLSAEAASLTHYCLSPAVAAAIEKNWPENVAKPALSVAPTMDLSGFIESLNQTP